LGFLATFALCYQVDMGLGIAVGVLITKALPRFINKRMEKILEELHMINVV
jgi:predicted small secreted protein